MHAVIPVNVYPSINVCATKLLRQNSFVVWLNMVYIVHLIDKIYKYGVTRVVQDRNIWAF